MYYHLRTKWFNLTKEEADKLARKKTRIKRERRYFSHASCEVRTSRINPFSRTSAILLDISEHGFKIELKGNKSLKAAQAFWLKIKLSTFEIRSPSFFESYVTVVWFNEEQGVGGGVFSELTKDQEDIIEQILDYLKDNQPENLSSNFDPTQKSDYDSTDDDDEQGENKKKKKIDDKYEEIEIEEEYDVDDLLDDD